jgi:uncharacterized iron-regulated membrane protein
MSLPRDIARHRLFWAWHRRIGIVAAVLVLVLSLTGLALNHTDRLRLDERFVTWGWLLDWYGIDPPSEAVSFQVRGGRVTLLGDRLYLDREPLPGHYGLLAGAVAAGDFLAIAVDDRIMIVTEAGELVDRLGPESGVPNTVEAIGVDQAGQLLLRSGKSLFGASAETLEWTAASPATAELRWASPEPVHGQLLRDLQRDFRARILPLERVLLDIHSGRIGGIVGTILMDAAAILLLMLAVTGSWLWFIRRG